MELNLTQVGTQTHRLEVEKIEKPAEGGTLGNVWFKGIERRIAVFADAKFWPALVVGATDEATIEVKPPKQEGKDPFVYLKGFGARPAGGFKGGGSYKESWTNTREGREFEHRNIVERLKFEQRAMNVRTALMQAVVADPAHWQAEAEKMLAWIEGHGYPLSPIAAPKAPEPVPEAKNGDAPDPVKEAVKKLDLSKDRYRDFAAVCQSKNLGANHVLVKAVAEGVENADGLFEFVNGMEDGPNPPNGS